MSRQLGCCLTFLLESPHRELFLCACRSGNTSSLDPRASRLSVRDPTSRVGSYYTNTGEHDSFPAEPLLKAVPKSLFLRPVCRQGFHQREVCLHPLKILIPVLSTGNSFWAVRPSAPQL